MKTKIITLLIVLIMPVFGLKAQCEQTDIIIEQSSSSDDGFIVTDQNELDNIFSIPVFVAEENIVKVSQFGENNSATMNQQGEHQYIGLYQDGSNNKAIFNNSGNNIYNLVSQLGNDNYIEYDIENSFDSQVSSRIMKSSQIGDENKILLETGATNYSNVEVHQQGNNNNVSLNIADAGTQTEPYSVTQTGNNADITITKSAFYMPMKTNQ